MLQAFFWIGALVLAATAPARAQTELSIYGGGTLFSGASGGSSGAGSSGYTTDWGGVLGDVGGRYGARIVWWGDGGSGLGLDFDLASVLVATTDLAPEESTTLELGEGSGRVTVNMFHRWKNRALMVPYVGAGIGLSLPQVEGDSGGASVSGYQIGGPAMQWIAGASLPLESNWAVFGEYKGSFAASSFDFSGGGAGRTDVFSNAINIGVTLGF